MGSDPGRAAPAGFQRGWSHQAGRHRSRGRHGRDSCHRRRQGLDCGFGRNWLGRRLGDRFGRGLGHWLGGFGNSNSLGFGRHRLGRGFLDSRSGFFRGHSLGRRFHGLFRGGLGRRLGNFLHGLGGGFHSRLGLHGCLGGRFGCSLGGCLGLLRWGFHNVSPLESGPGTALRPPWRLPGRIAAVQHSNPSCCQISWFVCRLPVPKIAITRSSTRFLIGFLPDWPPNSIFWVFWSARDCSGSTARCDTQKINRWRIETTMKPSAFNRLQANSLPQTRHCSRPCTKISLGRSMPINTILLFFFSPSAQTGPRSLPMSWCTPWKITLRSVPSMFSTPL